MSDYLDFNRNRWNEVSRKRENPYTIPITHEEYERQKDRPLEVILTVGKKVPAEWFERAPGKKLLGLACGGGQQGPMLASVSYTHLEGDFAQGRIIVIGIIHGA